MKQSHPNCQENHCRICLKESDDLGERFDTETGVKSVDHLGLYHSWLKTKGINPETEWGWWSAEAFAEENITAYIARYKE